ncbi:MAG: DUF6287 domain-containing protein [Streptococcus sp.]
MANGDFSSVAGTYQNDLETQLQYPHLVV